MRRHALRDATFRRWIAAGVAVSWLFTVLSCAADGDLVAVFPDPVAPITVGADVPGSQQPDSGAADDCCQSQASAILSFAPFKLPVPQFLPSVVSLLVLFVVAQPIAVSRSGRVPSLDFARRRSEILAHSLQAQAPPR